MNEESSSQTGARGQKGSVPGGERVVTRCPDCRRLVNRLVNEDRCPACHEATFPPGASSAERDRIDRGQ